MLCTSQIMGCTQQCSSIHIQSEELANEEDRIFAKA